MYSMHSEMTGLCRGQMSILLLHPLAGFLNRAVAPGLAASKRALLLYPGAQPLSRAELGALRYEFGGRSQTFDGNQPAYRFWIDACEEKCDVAAQRVGNNGDRQIGRATGRERV